MFDAAGSDEDLRRPYHNSQIDDATHRARALLRESGALLSSESAVAAEGRARAALGSFASALNWAEDTPREDEAHSALDAAGRWVRTTFGCRVEQEGTEYFASCPVSLGHARVGLSAGGQARRMCSLCGEDLSECEHLPGVAYRVPGGAKDLGWCRVCRSKGSCAHSPDESYRAFIVAVITEMQLDEVSIVPKPAHPDARIQRISISVQELQSALGPEWTPGMVVSCDMCLSDCGGLRRP